MGEAALGIALMFACPPLAAVLMALVCTPLKPRIIHFLGIWLVIKFCTLWTLLPLAFCTSVILMGLHNSFLIGLHNSLVLSEIAVIVLDALLLRLLLKQSAFAYHPTVFPIGKALSYSTAANLLLLAFVSLFVGKYVELMS